MRLVCLQNDMEQCNTRGMSDGIDLSHPTEQVMDQDEMPHWWVGSWGAQPHAAMGWVGVPLQP